MEVTLYDSAGHPVAYIADDGDKSIYLWKGHAVAYISEEKIYGWNGKHLGWFVNGVLFDLRGHRVGSIGENCPRALYAQPAKFAKLAKYAKYARFAAFAKSALSTGYSNEPLEVFLKGGAVGNI
ncbi:4-fold beta flower protein [Pseudomonas sp. S2_E02]